MGEVNTVYPIEKAIINDIEVPVAIPSGYANVSDTTATADTVMEGKEFYNAQGEKTVGTYKDMLQARIDETNNASYLFYQYRGTNPNIAKGLDTSNVEAMANMFYYCINLTNLDVSNFNTSNVVNMSGMFYTCEKLTSLDLSSFNTNKNTTLADMFRGCRRLTSLDLSNWNTNNVMSMSYMFYSCSVLTSLDLSSFNTSNVTNMASMFAGCSRLTGITFGENFNTGNVTSMSYMFNYCSNLTSLDLSSWDMTKVTNTQDMFSSCQALTNVILPSTIKTIGSSFFNGCTSLTEFTILAETPPTLANTSNCISTATTKIKIPAGTLSAYQSATNWSAYSDLFEELPA